MNTNSFSLPKFLLRFALFLFVVLAFEQAWGQTTYTWQGANGSWATTTNWTPTRTTPAANDILVFNGGTVTPTNVPTQTIGRLVIQGGANVTLTGTAARTLTIGNGADPDLFVDNGSTLSLGTNINITLSANSLATISGTLTIPNGLTYNTNGTNVATTVIGTINNLGTITCATASKLNFNNGSTYNHKFTTTAGTIPTATWNDGSTCLISGYTTPGNGTTPGGLGQSFYNFTWDCANQDDRLVSWNTNMTVRNNYTLISTGTNYNYFDMNATIAGNYIQSGGELRLTRSNTNASVTINGNFSLSSGELNIDGGNGGSTLNLSGNFSMTNGTLTESGSGSGAFIFDKTGTQTFTKTGGTISNTINFTVNSGSNLDMGTSVLDGSTGTFTLSSGATLTTAHADGINSAGASGSIQTTTRTFNSGANLIYNASGAQATGTFTTSTNPQINDITFSGSGAKTFSDAKTINGVFSIEGTATVAGTAPNFGTDATLQYKGSALQTTGIEFPTTFSGTGGVVIDNANGVNLSGNHTINYALTLTSGAFSIGTNTLTLNGTVPVCGTLIGGSTSNLTISGSSSNTFIPSVSLNNLTLNRTNGATLCGDVTVTGTLTLTNGNLTLGDYNLTLGTGATISGSPYNNTKMIVTSGVGNLVKQGTLASQLNMDYPLGTGTNYTPASISSFSGTIGSPGSISIRAVSGLAPTANPTDLNKHWIISTNNLSGYTANLSLTYANPGEVNGIQSAYVIRYSTTPSTTWLTPANPSLSGLNPMTTTGTSVLDGTWTAIENLQTWYTLASGNWTDFNIWTLDPAGALPNNPTNYYPQSASDNVVIKDGKTVTMNTSGLTCRILTVDGRLNLASTSGHTITALRGTGRMLLSSDYWPAAMDDSYFIDPNQGNGTVVYFGSSFNISNSRTFCNLDISMNAADTLTLLNNLTLNGSLNIKTGTIKINDNSSTTVKTIIVKGDVTVDNGASLRTGRGNTRGTYSIPGALPTSGNYHGIFHQLEIWGNLTNNGTIRFTNQTAPNYTQFTTTGAVTVRFKGLSDNLILCNGTTDFYNLIVDKGTDQTYILELTSTNTNNFSLYGPNFLGINTAAPFTALNFEERKALWIYKGTLKLTGDINIPTLTEGNSDTYGNADFHIGGNGCLWIAGPNVTVYTTANDASQIPVGASGLNTGSGYQAMSVYGKFRVSDGTFSTRNSAGFIFWSAGDGVVLIEGGTSTVAQFRSANAGGGQTSYIHTGGTLRVGESGEITNAYPIFGFDSPDGVFTMSGGEIQILGQSGNANDFYLPIASGNYSITGGKLLISVNGGITLDYSSTVPFYNVELSRKDASGTATLSLNSTLKALNDLTLGNNVTFNTNNNNVFIGRNFTTGATASTYTAGTNTTWFNGGVSGFINNSSTLSLYNLTISKNPHPSNGVYYELYTAGTGQLNIANNILITEGALNTTVNSPNVAGNIEITKGIIKSTVSGLPSTGKLVLNGVTTQTLNGDGLKFGSITLNNGNNGMQILSDVVIEDLSFNSSGTAKVNIGSYKLTVNGTITNADATNRWVYSSGNNSDGGLNLYVNQNGAYSFPIGVSATKYTPNSMTVSSFSDDGYINCIPVNEALATTNASGGAILPFHWKIKYDSFTTLPQVAYTFTYNETDNALYVPGKVLDASPYTRSQVGDVSKVDEPSNTIIFDTPFTLEKANYTAGEAARFTGTPRIFYTRDINADGFQAKWTDGNAWTLNPTDLADDANTDVDSYELHDSRQLAAGTYPGAGDIAVIGWVPWSDAGRATALGMPHGICIDGVSITCAEVVFNQMLDASGNPTARQYRYNFQFRPTLVINGAGQLTAGMVRGEGMFWNRWSDPNFTTMDIGEFAAQDSSYILYERNADGNINNLPNISPNLLIATEGWGDTDRPVTLNKTIITNGNLELLGDVNLVLPTGATGDLTIGKDLYLYERGTGGGAQLLFGNAGTNRNVSIGRDLIMNNSGALISVDAPNTGDPDNLHNLYVGRNIVLNTSTNGLDLWSSNTGDNINLILNGTENMTYTYVSGAIPDFYRLIINKGNSLNTTAQFNGDFNLNGPTSGAGIAKALELQNGNFIVNNSNISMALTSGNDNFSIPSTACIEIQAGTVTANGGSGIYLDGKLAVTNNGILNMQGGDNPIVVSASGNANLTISGSGSLTVGGQIRRAVNTEIGILDYIQTGGTVILGYNSATATTRGVFEVMGIGSSLTITGGSLSIVRASSASVPAIYLMPETVNLAPSNTINIGHSSLSGQNIGIYASEPLQNLSVVNGNTAKIMTIPLTLSGNLNITSGTFDANGLDLYIGGNMTNSATFVSNNNTTIFNGTGNQIITGNNTFYNFEKTNNNDVSFSSPVTITNNFIVDDGRILDNGNTITVTGDIEFNGTHVHSTGGNGIYLNGTSEQTLEGSNGLFDVLTISNPAGVNTPIGNTFTVSDSLQLEEGVFQINKNLLTLDANCIIVPVNPYSTTNMIQTNASFTDNGIKKILNAGAQTFLFPLGSGGRYTPVSIDLTATSSGSLRIVAAAEMHPSVIEDSEALNTPNTEITDADNVLQYHWIVDADGITGLSGTIKMKYNPLDVSVTAPYDITNYITARILSDGTGLWNKYGDDFNEVTNELTFNFSNNNDAAISGDYTAGVANAIPNNVPIYVTVASDGDWDSPTTWATYNPSNGDTGVPGVSVPSGGPRGCILYVDKTLRLPVNFMSAYETIITSTGIVNIGTTFGHRLGTVSGEGLIVVSSGSLPAGVYTDFFLPNKGSLEYTGTDDYEVLSGINIVNNLILSGSGDRGFPNLNVQLYGDLTISGADVINTHNRSISIKGDILFNSGSFNANNGTFILNGSSPQIMGGTLPFSGTFKHYNLQVNNSSGVTVNNDLDLGNQLTLTNGKITMGSNKVITLATSSTVSGGSASAYVNGKMAKDLISGNNFVFQVGNSTQYKRIEIRGTSATTKWSAQYMGDNTNTIIETTPAQDIIKVSLKDRWFLGCPISATGNVRLYWNTHSNVGDGGSTAPYSTLRVAMENASTKWESKGNTGYSGNVNSGYITSGSVSFSDHFFTIATADPDAPLPVELLYFKANPTLTQVDLYWSTASELNNDYFEVQRSTNGRDFTVIGKVDGNGTTHLQNNYTFTDYSPISGTSYYRLKQVDFNNEFEIHKMVAVNFEGAGSDLGSNQIKVFPNPYQSGQLDLEVKAFEAATPIELAIYDVTGKVVYRVGLTVPEDQTVNLIPQAMNQLNKGVYIVQVHNGTSRFTQKMVIE